MKVVFTSGHSLWAKISLGELFGDANRDLKLSVGLKAS